MRHRHAAALIPGYMLKIDFHTHILPENWPDLKERYGYGGFKVRPDIVATSKGRNPREYIGAR